MKTNPIFHRHSIRLKKYDYAQAGAYFITICTQNREPLFGEIVHGEMQLNELGKIVHYEWENTAVIRAEIELGTSIVMPNHFHAIVYIVEGPCRGIRPDAPTRLNGPASKSIGAIMAGFKSAVTKRINLLRHTPGLPVWQRNYYEHILRDEKLHAQIAAYIEANPAQWELDTPYPGNMPC